MKCDIFGYPTPAITWTRSLNQLPLNRHVIDYNWLIIRNTTKDDDGAYVCQGTNKLGSVMAVTWVIVKDVGKLADVTDQHDRNEISLKRKEGRGHNDEKTKTTSTTVMTKMSSMSLIKRDSLFLSTLTVGIFPFSESQHGFQSSQ